MNRFLNTIILSTLAVTLVACNGSGGKTSSISNDGSGSDTSTITESSTLLQSYEYDFTVNGCATNKQTFTSLEDLCSGLQNNTLNNNCAISAREKYFRKTCVGKAFMPFSSNTNGSKTIEVSMRGFDVKNLDLNSTTLDVLKTSPDKVADQRSALTIFSCLDNDSARSTSNNGFILLNDSRAVINRDLNYVFRDNTRSSKLEAHALLNCAKDADKSNREYFSEADYISKKLKIGDAVMVPVIVSPGKVAEVSSELTFISCAENMLDATTAGINGVMLLRGSKLIVKKDLNYYAKTSDNRDNVIVSCD